MSDAEYFEMNRVGWDQRAKAHMQSQFYDVDGFLAGNTSLREIELAELPNVRGRKLLHLQCHFGLDTLSWARRGAICTGVDISPVAIQQARELSERAKLNAEFVCSDVYGFKRENAELYDIVFTSYGTICWLPDLDRWAEVVASNLAINGTFYIVDFHPIYNFLAGYSYFTSAMPDVEEEGTYTDDGADVVAKLATWGHPLSSVVSALIRAGIQVERLREFSFSPYKLEGMVERESGRYYLNHKGHDTPIVYSFTGRKVA